MTETLGVLRWTPLAACLSKKGERVRRILSLCLRHLSGGVSHFVRTEEEKTAHGSTDDVVLVFVSGPVPAPLPCKGPRLITSFISRLLFLN